MLPETLQAASYSPTLLRGVSSASWFDPALPSVIMPTGSPCGAACLTKLVVVNDLSAGSCGAAAACFCSACFCWARAGASGANVRSARTCGCRGVRSAASEKSDCQHVLEASEWHGLRCGAGCTHLRDRVWRVNVELPCLRLV